MIELLILYELSKKTLTMYGISKEINSEFSVLTTPSYGTIKPALKRLEKTICVRTQKTMSAGGRPSTFYSITEKGYEYLSSLLLASPLENPIQFLPSARVKLACAEVLKGDDKIKMFKTLKVKSESIIIDINNILQMKDLDFYHKMVFDNLICEYKNFTSLLEGFERASKN